MEGSVGAPPQRVCPKCARISWATGPQCPYCRARFTRSQGITPWMLAATALVVLAGVLVMLLIAGHQFNQQLDDRVESVNKEFDADVNRIRDDVRRELDTRLPPAGAVTPTPPPVATPTPESEGTPTPTPSASASPSPTATESPTIQP